MLKIRHKPLMWVKEMLSYETNCLTDEESAVDG